MDKITISIKDGIASIINLSPEQAQEILDKYIENKNKKQKTIFARRII